MKYVILSLLLFVTAICNAQKADSSFQYCEATILPNFPKKGYVLTIEDDVQTGALKDETGKNRSFKTKIAAINYLAKQGWELAHIYPDARDSTASKSCYLFKRKVAL